MERRGLSLAAGLLGALTALSAPAGAQNILVGSINTFSGGTTEGWMVNLLGQGGAGAKQPVVWGSNGPGGVNDAYMLMVSRGGSGGGSRLTSLNPGPTWTGDYLAAGVDAIQLDARNFSRSDLSLRLMFENPTATSGPTDVALTSAFLLPAAGGWTHLSFSLSSLQLLDPSSMDLTRLMSGVTSMRIVHSPAVGFPPPSVVGELGIDNIAAVATVPEPATVMLLGGGLAVLGAFARRRRA